jgi:hypothetical protein
MPESPDPKGSNPSNPSSPSNPATRSNPSHNPPVKIPNVCGKCYEAMERYAAHLRNTLRTGMVQAYEYPPAPALCEQCRTAMAELRAIYVAKDDTGFRFGV